MHQFIEAMTQQQNLLHSRTAQIQIAITQTNFLVDRLITADFEGRSVSTVEHF
jgi:hypothetical protein